LEGVALIQSKMMSGQGEIACTIQGFLHRDSQEKSLVYDSVLGSSLNTLSLLLGFGEALIMQHRAQNVQERFARLGVHNKIPLVA